MAPAIYHLGEVLTYSDLNSMATRLAGQMMLSLSEKQQFVPLFFEKSPLYSIALLAVLKCGRAFVPVDVSNPPQSDTTPPRAAGDHANLWTRDLLESQSGRLRLVCRRPWCLLCLIWGLKAPTQRLRPYQRCFQWRSPAIRRISSSLPDRLATQKPSLVSHGAYAHAARAHSAGINIDSGSRVSQFASYAFDTSMEDHLTTFIVGACLCVPTETERETELVEFINRSRANWLHITPSIVDMILPDSVPTLVTMVVGGEPHDQP